MFERAPSPDDARENETVADVAVPGWILERLAQILIVENSDHQLELLDELIDDVFMSDPVSIANRALLKQIQSQSHASKIDETVIVEKQRTLYEMHRVQILKAAGFIKSEH